MVLVHCVFDKCGNQRKKNGKISFFRWVPSGRNFDFRMVVCCSSGAGAKHSHNHDSANRISTLACVAPSSRTVFQRSLICYRNGSTLSTRTTRPSWANKRWIGKGWKFVTCTSRKIKSPPSRTATECWCGTRFRGVRRGLCKYFQMHRTVKGSPFY